MNTKAVRVTVALSVIELAVGTVVIFMLDGGSLTAAAKPLLWSALVLSGGAGLLVRRAGGSGLLAGAAVSAAGLAALTILGWATAQAPLPGGQLGPELLVAVAVLLGGAVVGWAGGVTWAVRRQPHLWT